MLFSGISNIIEIVEHRDWITVRRTVTDDKIREVYGLFDALWPLRDEPAGNATEARR